MKRLQFLAGLLGFPALGQTILETIKAQPTRTTGKKYYITGLGNDCEIPPIVAYGTDRVNALLNCCESGGLTVWDAPDWERFQRESGKQFEESCEAMRQLKATLPHGLTFKRLPPSPGVGTVAQIDDSSVTQHGAIVHGAGTHKIYTVFDGTNWVVMEVLQ